MDRFFATLTRGKILALLGLLLVIVVLPLTLVYLKRQQEIRSRAAGEAVAFSLIPETDTKNIGESFDIRLLLNGHTNNIAGLDIILTFDPSIVDFSFAPSTIFNQQLINRVTAGSFRYVAVSTTQSTITGDAIDIGIISLKTKAVGQTALTFTKTQVVAEKIIGALPIGTNSTGSYTVVLAPTATPTSLPTNTPTPTTIPTATPLPTNTPIPTSTPTPLPTNTPIPSATQTPLPTSTPVPTEAPTATPTPLPITGDIDGDGIINLLDFNLWRDELLDELEGKLTQKKSDLNKDNIIDLLDFNIWRDALIDTLTK